MSVVSLCIPRVFPNISEARIRYIFDQLSLGKIERIDIVSTTNAKGELFNRIFIHFIEWFKNENADHALQRLHKGDEIKVIYDDPWFWKVSLYKKKPQQQKQKQQPAVRIEFADIPIAPRLSTPLPSTKPPVIPRKLNIQRNTNKPHNPNSRNPDKYKKNRAKVSLEEGEIAEYK
jgi:hypothetical protein